MINYIEIKKAIIPPIIVEIIRPPILSNVSWTDGIIVNMTAEAVRPTLSPSPIKLGSIKASIMARPVLNVLAPIFNLIILSFVVILFFAHNKLSIIELLANIY